MSDDSMTFTEWLEETLELQRTSFGADPPALEGDERANYIMWNVLAAKVELGEFLAETGWKPWSQDRGWVARDKAVEELVDVLHFVANVACAIGLSGEELSARYGSKRRINAARQAKGYRGVGHCPSCGVDLVHVDLLTEDGQEKCGRCFAVVRETS